MPTYVTLANFTGLGIKNVKDTVKRAEAFEKMAISLGVQVKDFYYVIGRYDIVIITEAPDSAAATALALSVGSLGNVRTETLEALTREEMAEVITKMPFHVEEGLPTSVISSLRSALEDAALMLVRAPGLSLTNTDRPSTGVRFAAGSFQTLVVLLYQVRPIVCDVEVSGHSSESRDKLPETPPILELVWRP